MTDSPVQIRWIRLLITGLAIVLISFLIIMVATIVYAFVLAFKARGAPDQEMISQFAEWLGIWLTPILTLVLTYLGAALVARKAGNSFLLHGLLLGIIIALFSFLETKIFGGSLDFKEGVYLAFYIGTACLGGLREGRKKQ